MKCEYIHSGRSWPNQFPQREGGSSVVDEVIVMVDPDEGSNYEFVVSWYQFGSSGYDDKYHPRAQMFNDAWQAFVDFPQLFEALGHRPSDTVQTSPSDLIDVLEALGFRDARPEIDKRSVSTSRERIG